MSKTILHLTGMKSTKYGGIEHYLLELARLCNKRGYKTILQYESLPQSKTYLDDLEAIGTDIIVKSINSNLLNSSKRVTKIIRSTKPDIIQNHFVNKYVHLSCPIIARMFGVQKIIFMTHSIQNKKMNFIKRNIFNQYDHILTVSKAIADNLLQIGVDPKVVSTNYLGLFGKYEISKQLRIRLRKDFGIPDQAVVLACIAFDNPVKGLDILLKAFEQVGNNKSEIHLIIIGVNPLISNLRKEADKLKLSNRIHWVGIIDKGWEILNVADIYVQPSRWEGLGLAIIEAMAMGLPVVATRTGGIPEVVIDGETGILAEAGSVIGLADAINRMLADPLKWKTFSENGIHRYQKFFNGRYLIKNLIEHCYD